MPFASRPIAAFAVVGALSLLVSGCSGGDGDPTPSATRTTGASSSSASSPTPTSAAGTESGASEAPASEATDPADDDTPGAFPGTGETVQPDADPSAFPATAVVTFAGWDAGTKTLQAGGLVSGTTNTSGTCTFTAKKGGTTRTAESAAQASASSVNCAQVSFPAAQVSSGTWSVTLQYSVGSASTTSDPMTAEVP
ncbi:hypothetical protein JOE58_001309 [Curtobacterium luteum]|uniref:Bacterial Ig domain-containing protein n=1 Tax=Curtobacterium luteum TaxID=33881 RepID=A0ABS2RTI4_9MICO|nr:hypothetical protein [Curtobacterium luteum]MBM7802058.1 hypothetical protein [Curtobacterium luteum]NUU51332.1 hypothetical protein [Curtobacterium luteum]